MLGDVAVKALVQGLEPQKVGGGTVRGSGAFALPKHSRRVVMQVVQGALPSVSRVGNDIMLGDSGCQFKVTVGHGAGGAFIGLEGPLDGYGEWLAPEDGAVGMGRRVGRKEGHASHAGTGGVASTGRVRWRWDDFSKSGWALAKFRRNPPEIIQEIVHVGGETKPGAVGKRVLEGGLKGAEETPRTGDGQHHGAQFAHDFVPVRSRDAGSGARERV